MIRSTSTYTLWNGRWNGLDIDRGCPIDIIDWNVDDARSNVCDTNAIVSVFVGQI